VNSLAAGREKNPSINETLDCGPSIVPRSMTRNSGSLRVADLSALSVDELWRLRDEVGALLAGRISGELDALKKRLEQLKAQDQGNPLIYRKAAKPVSRTRRPYPPVLPKYQNPSEPSEIWSGRGKQPRWLIAQLVQGKYLDDFLIAAGAANKMRPVTGDEMANGA